MPVNHRGEDYATMPIGYIEAEYNSLYALTRDLFEKAAYKSISRETREALYTAARSAEKDMNRVKRLLKKREDAEGGNRGLTFPRTSPAPRTKSVAKPHSIVTGHYIAIRLEPVSQAVQEADGKLGMNLTRLYDLMMMASEHKYTDGANLLKAVQRRLMHSRDDLDMVTTLLEKARARLDQDR